MNGLKSNENCQPRLGVDSGGRLGDLDNGGRKHRFGWRWKWPGRLGGCGCEEIGSDVGFHYTPPTMRMGWRGRLLYVLLGVGVGVWGSWLNESKNALWFNLGMKLRLRRRPESLGRWVCSRIIGVGEFGKKVNMVFYPSNLISLCPHGP